MSIKVLVGLLVFYYELSWFVSIFNVNKNYTYFLTIILYYIYMVLWLFLELHINIIVLPLVQTKIMIPPLTSLNMLSLLSIVSFSIFGINQSNHQLKIEVQSLTWPFWTSINQEIFIPKGFVWLEVKKWRDGKLFYFVENKNKIKCSLYKFSCPYYVIYKMISCNH